MTHPLLAYMPEVGTHAMSEVAREAYLSASISESDSEFADNGVLKLTAAMLELTDIRQLDGVLEHLFQHVERELRARLGAPVRQSLRGILKRVAIHTVPIVHRELPAAMAGTSDPESMVMSAARLFGLELEGLSPEDKEFEITKRFVRFAGDAVANALTADQVTAPTEIVCLAIDRAARRYAPGLLRNATRHPRGSGTWHRKNGLIVVFNC